MNLHSKQATVLVGGMALSLLGLWSARNNLRVFGSALPTAPTATTIKLESATVAEALLPHRAPILMTQYGELGNHLLVILHGKATSLLASKEYGIDTELHMRLLRGTPKPYILATWKMLQGCFSNIRKDVRFESTDPDRDDREVKTRTRQQKKWLGPELSELLTFYELNEPFESFQRNINRSLKHLRKILDGMVESKGDVSRKCSQEIDLPDSNSTKTVEYSCLPPVTDNATIKLPLIILGGFASLGEIDANYEDLREFVEFDDDGEVDGHKCCDQSPDPDESTLHFRNFAGEFSEEYMAKRMVPRRKELDPLRTATEIFKPGDRVAMTTRVNDDNARKYVEALQARNISARIVSGQRPQQDYCFLKRSQVKLVGLAASSFSTLAGLFSDKRKLPLVKYSLDVHKANFQFNITWTNPELAARITHPLFPEYGD